MIRNNLATRPFYNDRAVRIGLGAAVLVVAALTAFNVLQVMALNDRAGEMTTRAQRAEAESGKFRDQARAIGAAMDTAEVSAVQEAAHEANRLIEQRAFSWTELFNRFESTLPADVRISAVEPQLDRDGRLLLVVSVISRTVEDLHAFIDELEASGGLRDVISRQDSRMEDGMLQSVLQGYYNALANAETATPPSEASESSGTAANRSPAGSNRSPAAPSGRGDPPSDKQ